MEVIIQRPISTIWTVIQDGIVLQFLGRRSIDEGNYIYMYEQGKVTIGKVGVLQFAYYQLLQV